MERAMSRGAEPILPGLLFFAAIYKLSEYPLIGGAALLIGLALWFVGWLAIRMFSSTVHQLGFWGWVRLLEVAVWCVGALYLVPLTEVTTFFLLWGVATPLMFVGNVWRRAYERFPPIQFLMRGLLVLIAVLTAAAAPVAAWRYSGIVIAEPLLVLSGVLGTLLSLFYGWRLAAPAPTGQYDARVGSFEAFKRRGVSGER
jgi:hypothetical protein